MSTEQKHADPRPVIEFDHHALDYADEATGIFREIRAKCPVAWTDKHDGFWVVSKYQDVTSAARDTTTFSSDFDPEGLRTGYSGVHIPPHSPETPRFVPTEVDPPDSIAIRRIVNSEFSPEAVKRLQPFSEQLVTFCIDRRIETGAVDLIRDIASPVPAMLTMHLFGVPLDGWPRWSEPLHNVVATQIGTPEHDAALAGVGAILADLIPLIAERRANPGTDLVSRVVHGTIDGEPLSDQVVHEFLITLLLGGIDTTTSLLGHALVWLDAHPEDRARLIAEPELIPQACEEFLRWSSPNNMVSRTATIDTAIDGQRIAAGERIMLCYNSANRDESVFDRADEFVIDRSPNRHVSFGIGSHRCLGSFLARMEFGVVLGEILRRMPDYKVVPGGAQRYRETAVIDGWVQVPATFTPGPKLGSSLDLDPATA